MQETWGFIDTKHLDAATNMALDECMINWLKAGDIPPTIRFYGWETPTLSIGKNQRVSRSIDLDALSSYGFEFVRRLTGGSAVLHDDELTYSLVVNEDHPNIPESVTQAYYILAKGVLEGYRALGIDADFAIPKREIRKERTAVCFEKSAFYEMVVDGKKISGNAQTRQKGILMQHGSIPMSMDEEALFDLFNFRTERMRERQRNSFRDKAISINDITNKKHTYDMLKAAFYEGFQKGLNITLKPISFTNHQWEEVNLLKREKYSEDEWNLYNEKERASHGKGKKNKKEKTYT